MTDFENGKSPWHSKRDEIRTISISGISNIGNYAFDGCEKISQVEFDADMNTIGEGSFINCKGLTTVIFPTTTEVSIGQSAFENCEKLESVTWGGVTSIGKSSFKGCAITSLTLEATVTSISENAFQNTKISSVTFNGNSDVCNKVSAFEGSEATEVSVKIDFDDTIFCGLPPTTKGGVCGSSKTDCSWDYLHAEENWLSMEKVQ